MKGFSVPLQIAAPALSCLSVLAGLDVQDDFSTDPLATGHARWQVVGDADLFRWDSTAHNLAVTWDSARANSFCLLPLGQSLTSANAFNFAWDLTLIDAGARPDSPRTNVLQLSVALVRQSRLPAGYPQRTTSGRAQDLLDFSFFPLADYGPFGAAAYVAPVAFGGKQAGYSFGNPYDLADGVTHRIQCRWDPITRRFYTDITGTGPVQPTDPALPADDDFAVDALAIIVWNEAATPRDSLLAHGTLDNVTLVVTDPGAPPLGRLGFDPASRTVRCDSRAGYRYQLEASGDLVSWTGLQLPVDGTGGELTLGDFRKALFPQQFYRVRATAKP